MTTVAPVRELSGKASAGRGDWARRFFSTIDAMDSPGFAAFFTEDGSFTMANNPAFVGRAAITEFVRGFFAAIKGIAHETLNVWEGPAILFTEGIVTYTMHNGRTVSHGYLGVMEFEGDLIRSYRAYLDPQPLMSALQQSQQ